MKTTLIPQVMEKFEEIEKDKDGKFYRRDENAYKGLVVS